jgi:hypothetical protein
MNIRSLFRVSILSLAAYASLASAAPSGAQPTYNVADRWEFRMTETPGVKAATWAREVIEIRPGLLEVRFRDGRVATYDAAMNLLDAEGEANSRILVRYPLLVGDTWTFRRVVSADRRIEERGTVHVTGVERVAVPAGSFECFRIDADSRVNERDYNEERLWQRWYCPDVKWIAKERFELRTWRADAPPTDIVDVSELVRFLPGR